MGLFLLVSAVFGASCGGAPPEPAWPKVSDQWYKRASESFQAGDIEDAKDAIQSALAAAPGREEARILGAKIALAELEYDRVLQLLKGLDSTEARGIRARALWYSLDLEGAADELDQLLSDPSVKDPWAKDIAGLARRGAGRTPFVVSGGLVAVTEMPRVSSPAFLVPLEVNGEQALAMVATGSGEVVVDSSRGATPGYLSLRFAERIEVRDVPAIARDLSFVSRQLNAPVKLLIGMNLLRHLNATVDFVGSQFVVRSFEPPPPPVATTVKLNYLRGGGMLLQSGVGSETSDLKLALLVDTAQSFPVALAERGWKKVGTAPEQFQAVPGSPNLRQGVLPLLRLGAFEVPEVPGLRGAPLTELEKTFGVDIDGMVGSSLLASFRITFADRAKTMWLEALPREVMEQIPASDPQPQAPLGTPARPEASPPSPHG